MGLKKTLGFLLLKIIIVASVTACGPSEDEDLKALIKYYAGQGMITGADKAGASGSAYFSCLKRQGIEVFVGAFNPQTSFNTASLQTALSGAKAAGLKTAAYHAFNSAAGASSSNTASFLKTVDANGGGAVFLDVEVAGGADSLVNQWYQQACSSHACGYYTAKWVVDKYGYPTRNSTSVLNKMSLWVAAWNGNGSVPRAVSGIGPWTTAQGHQYKNDKSFCGAETDLNVFTPQVFQRSGGGDSVAIVAAGGEGGRTPVDDGGFIVDDGGSAPSRSGGSSGEKVSGCRLTVDVSWDGTGDPTANLRSGPGTSYGKSGSVSEGDSFSVVSIDRNGENFSYSGKSDSTWYQISTLNGKAWLWGGYANANCGGSSGGSSSGSTDGDWGSTGDSTSGGGDSGFIIDDSSAGDSRVGTADGGDSGFIIDDGSSDGRTGSTNGDVIDTGSGPSSDGGFIIDEGGDSGAISGGETVSGCSLEVSVSWDGTGDPTANLRSGPGTTYNKVGQVREGESYTVISIDRNGQNFSYSGKSDSTWYQINGPSGKAWLWGGYANSSCPGGGSSSTGGGGDSGDGGFSDDGGSSGDSGFIIDDGSSPEARTGTADNFITPPDSSNSDDGFIVDMGSSNGETIGGGGPGGGPGGKTGGGPGGKTGGGPGGKTGGGPGGKTGGGPGGGPGSGPSGRTGAAGGGTPVSGCQLRVNVSWDGTGDPTANLRSGPGTSYGKMGTVSEGESYSVISIDANGENFSYAGKSDSTWYQISVNGNNAWLWGGYGSSDCSGGGSTSGGGTIDDTTSGSGDDGFIIDDPSGDSRTSVGNEDTGFIIDNS